MQIIQNAVVDIMKKSEELAEGIDKINSMTHNLAKSTENMSENTESIREIISRVKNILDDLTN